MATILQIGEGNFLRAFVEEYIQNACDNGYKGSVAICQPRTNNKVINALNGQNRIYDIIHRGRINGRVIDDRCRITCVSDCIDTVNETDRLIDTFCSDELQIVVSNTTEAGIAFVETDEYSDFPNVSFPGKIAYMLYQRYKQNKGDLVFLPVELIENNGIELKNCILKYAKLWDFDEDFTDYVNTKCHFCNTLVDRIVTGHNQNDADPCSVTCEPYRLFIKMQTITQNSCCLLMTIRLCLPIILLITEPARFVYSTVFTHQPFWALILKALTLFVIW